MTGSCAAKTRTGSGYSTATSPPSPTSIKNEKSLTVQLDRDPETRDLPVWYLDQGHVDYGYALTGHKAQGVTTDHTFVIVDGTTDREWAYVAMSRGRQANTLYLTTPKTR